MPRALDAVTQSVVSPPTQLIEMGEEAPGSPLEVRFGQVNGHRVDWRVDTLKEVLVQHRLLGKAFDLPLALDR